MTAGAAPLTPCWSCGSAGAARYCGACGVDRSATTGHWQDGVYIGRGAALYRRAPHEIAAVLPILFEPFKHLDAIPAATWRSITVTAVMGIAPLILVSLFEAIGDAGDAFRALGLYFSALWALFFAAAFHATGIRWRLGLAAYFGTTIIGMTLLLIALALNLEALRDPLVRAHSLLISIPSSIALIGFPEELTKALVLFAIWRWAKFPALRAFVFYGLLSGLGFGIKEGVGYQLGPYAAAAMKSQYGFAPFYLDSVLRLTSLPFFHAVWTGTAAFLIWFANRIPSARAGLIVLAIAIPATFHGLYDALVDRSTILSLIVVGSSMVVLGVYMASAAQFERWFGLAVDADDDLVTAPIRAGTSSAEAGSVVSASRTAPR